ncbi:hypothetical protein CH313_01655 [Streptomyces sp. TSRI0384-2]|nr:hypothetical protein CH313_01655 [Streptomyces sp. TSRI0384-2]
MSIIDKPTVRGPFPSPSRPHPHRPGGNALAPRGPGTGRGPGAWGEGAVGTPTVYDVAGRAGVSAATVSRVRRAPVAAAATGRGDHGAGRQVTTPERRVPSGPWTTRSAPGSSSPSTWRGSPGSCIPARPTRKGTTTGAAGR